MSGVNVNGQPPVFQASSAPGTQDARSSPSRKTTKPSRESVAGTALSARKAATPPTTLKACKKFLLDSDSSNVVSMARLCCRSNPPSERDRLQSKRMLQAAVDLVQEGNHQPGELARRTLRFFDVCKGIAQMSSVPFCVQILKEINPKSIPPGELAHALKLISEDGVKPGSRLKTAEFIDRMGVHFGSDVKSELERCMGGVRVKPDDLPQPPAGDRPQPESASDSKHSSQQPPSETKNTKRSPDPTTLEGKAGKSAYDAVVLPLKAKHEVRPAVNLKSAIEHQLSGLEGKSTDQIRGVTLGILQGLRSGDPGDRRLGPENDGAAAQVVQRFHLFVDLVNDKVKDPEVKRAIMMSAIALVDDPFESSGSKRIQTLVGIFGINEQAATQALVRHQREVGELYGISPVFAFGSPAGDAVSPNLPPPSRPVESKHPAPSPDLPVPVAPANPEQEFADAIINDDGSIDEYYLSLNDLNEHSALKLGDALGRKISKSRQPVTVLQAIDVAAPASSSLWLNRFIEGYGRALKFKPEYAQELNEYLDKCIREMDSAMSLKYNNLKISFKTGLESA